MIGLLVGALAMSLSSYVGLKQGLLFDKFGRVAAQKTRSPLIFWTLWSGCTLAALIAWGAIGMAFWFRE